MFKNYLKMAFRNSIRNKLGTFINIIGLAIGIASCILIFMYVRNEVNYDRHFENADNIYRVTTDFYLSEQKDRFAFSSLLLGPTLKEEYPEVQQAVRLMPIGTQTIWYKDKPAREEEMYYADTNMFRVFNFELLRGNPEKALLQPKSIVITENMAHKYFGDSDPMGQLLKFTKNTFTVTGVIKDNPNNTHIPAHAFLSMNTLDTNFTNQFREDWFRMTVYTYLKFSNAEAAKNFPPKLDQFFNKYLMPFIKKYQLNTRVKYRLQPIKDIHLTTDLLYDVEGNSNGSYVYIFSFVAIFILLIACINYMNMATARAVGRAKEVGVRKVLGANKAQLIMQFLSESVLITVVALCLALVFVEILLPYYGTLTEINTHKLFRGDAGFISVLICIVVFVGFVGGSYPAFFLSAFSPVTALKSQRMPNGSSSLLRKGLVIVQFTISTILVVGTLVVLSQMNFMKNSDLGFKKEQVLVQRIFADTILVKKLPALREELLRNSNIQSVSFAEHIPGETTGRLLFFIKENGKQVEKAMPMMFVDEHFLELLKIQLKEGRNFSKDFPTDKTSAFLINETAAHSLGWKHPIGMELENGLGYKGKVIGVMKDFHYTSLHKEIEPLVLMLPPAKGGQDMLIRINANDRSSTVNAIQSKIKQFDPRHVQEYFFLDENFDKQYHKEEKMLLIFGYFSALTIFIACLGLFGLAAFTAEQRTKEIGIRKVNGASAKDIVMLFVKDFMKLVIIALMLGWPLSFFMMNRWLRDFAYRIHISPISFLIAGVLAMTISLITVSYHALRIASTDPVKALRYE